MPGTAVYYWNIALHLGFYMVPSRIWSSDAQYAKSFFENRDVIETEIEYAEPIDIAAPGYDGSQEQLATERSLLIIYCSNGIIIKRSRPGKSGLPHHVPQDKRREPAKQTSGTLYSVFLCCVVGHDSRFVHDPRHFESILTQERLQTRPLGDKIALPMFGLVF